ncbi:hypothetical protein BGZ75_005622 [Mortierella antarctica]|nr:hypothetical protein BGZ75_005622 [Mortierella antarctica]
MHASLVEKDTREDVLLIKDTRSKEDMHFFKDNRTKATTGSSVSSLYPLKDFEDNGTESGFFVFPDLSVRMEGTYRLKFCLYEMVGKDVHFCAYVISDPLIVYSAKKFPGMEESTILSQYFAEQGLKIRIRKEVRPKKRSRGNYVMYGPTSQSPTGSQHQDQGDATESQDEEETSATAETSIASKRRASGTRSIEPKRGEAPLTPQSDALKHGEQDSRPALGQRGGSWRGPATEYAEKPSSSALDRPRSAHGAYPSKQPGHLDDSAFAGGRASAANRAANRAAEGVSHLDLNAGTRPDQRTDEYRTRMQDQGPVGRERGGFAGSSAWLGTAASQHPRGGGMARSPPMPMSHSTGRPLGAYAPESPTASFRSSSMAHGDGPGSRPGLYSVHESMDVYEPAIRSEPAYARPQTALLPEYVENPRRGSGTRLTPREAGVDSGFTYSARGAVEPQRHPRDPPHSAPYTTDDRLRAAQHPSFGLGPKSSEPGYPYVARPDYTSPPEQRPMDFASAAPYALDHHRTSVSAHPYDRTEHQPRTSAVPAGQPGPAFPPPLQQASYQQRSPREQQHQDQGNHMHTDVQEKGHAPHRPYSHAEPYSGHGYAPAPPPRPSGYGTYPGSDGHAPTSVYTQSPPGPHAPPEQEQGATGKYHSGYAAQEGVGPGSGRYTAHGPPSYKSGIMEMADRPTRESLGGAAVTRTGPMPVSPPRPQDYSAQPQSRHSISHRSESVSGPGSAGPGAFRYGFDERNPPSGYGEHHRELESDKSRRPSAQSSSGIGSYGAGPALGPRSASVVEQHYEDRAAYGHGRSHSSSSISRIPYAPSPSATAPLPKRASYSQAGEGMAGQGRAPGPYEGYEIGRGTHTSTTQVPAHAPGQSGYDGHSHGGRPHESEHEYAVGLGPVHAHAQGPPTSAPYYHGQPQSRPAAIVQPYYNQGQHYVEQHAPQAPQTQHPQHPQHPQYPQHHYMLLQQQQQQAPSPATHGQQYHTYAQQQHLPSAQPPPAGPHGHGYGAIAAAQGEDASKRSRV